MPLPQHDRATPESAVEAYLVRRLRFVNLYHHKNIVKKIGGPGWRGWPDRMVLFDGGCTHYVELKRPKGGEFEPLQLFMHNKLRKLGFQVYVLNTKALVEDYIGAVVAFGPYGVAK